jgi:hypothetical protein
MKTLHNNIAVNQTAVRKLRYKNSTVLAGSNYFIHNSQNAPNNN